ncbi:MAG: DUF4956 domain-containing protein [Clostridia bacterium]|nr:DUF4956 domain-containing protein [Clostridia bacterium]
MNANAIASIFSSQTITPASWLTIIFSLILAFGVGLFILWTYKTNYRGVMYSANFGLSLVLMTLITTPVVMCIRESIQLSMGMVGALSIVRFRTAVKEPLDTAYMFWALTMGILLGAGQFFLTVVVVLGISALIFLVTRMRSKTPNSYLLVLRMNNQADVQVSNLLASMHNQKLKSKTITRGGVEATYEICVDRQDALLAKIAGMPGVADATLVAYQNETV